MIEWGAPTVWGDSYVSHNRVVSAAVDSDIAAEYGIEPPFHRVWFSKLLPGGFAVPHVDASPYYDRWHIPLEPAGVFWQDGVYMEAPTEPFPVKHWLPHAVFNQQNKPRVHLMVDRDVQIQKPSSGLVLTDMIPEIQALIDLIL
jgi:hypothetical protein